MADGSIASTVRLFAVPATYGLLVAARWIGVPGV